MDMGQFYAVQFLERVARDGVEVNPKLLEGSIVASQKPLGYVVEFHIDARGNQFEVVRLMWNGIALQSYTKSVHVATGRTNFELAIKMVRRIHRQAKKRSIPTRYPNIEWIRF
jgi:hypothetical protein